MTAQSNPGDERIDDRIRRKFAACTTGELFPEPRDMTWGFRWSDTGRQRGMFEDVDDSPPTTHPQDEHH